MKIILRIILSIILILLFLISAPQKIYAQQMEQSNDIVSDGFDYIFEDADSGIEDTARSFAEGKFEFSAKEIFEKAVNIFAGEVYEQGKILKKLAYLSLLCGFLSTMGEALGKKEVSQTGFFVCLMVLIYIVLASLKTQCTYVYNTTQTLADNTKMLVPAFTAVMLSGGRGVQCTASMPIILTVSAFMVMFLQNVVLPCLNAVAVLQCINCISEKNILNSMCQLLLKAISVLIKGGAFVFALALSLQRVGTTALNSTILKISKSAVGAVPVVGDIMQSSFESAMAVSKLISNSISAAAVAAVVAVTAVPVLKISVMWLIYKLSASIMEPVCDKRIIKALNGAGDISATLISILFTIGAVYCMGTIIIISVF